MAIHKYKNPFKSTWFLWHDFGGWRLLNDDQLENPSKHPIPARANLIEETGNRNRVTIGAGTPFGCLRKDGVDVNDIVEYLKYFCEVRYTCFDDIIQGGF